MLGAKQHGHIDGIGFDLYTRLVAQAVNDARKRKDRFDQAVKKNGDSDAGEEIVIDGTAAVDETVHAVARAAPAPLGDGVAEHVAAPPRDDLDVPFDMEDPLAAPVTLDLPIDARIPIAFVEDEGLRLQLYRRIAAMTHDESLEEMRRELVDRFGADAETGGVPEEVDNLFYQIRVKTLAARAGVERIGRDLEQIVLYGEALENMDRRTLERRLRLALGKLSDENGRFVPEEAARVGRRAIYLPIDDEGRWQKALLRTLEIMAVG